jgi:hypothetical protein
MKKDFVMVSLCAVMLVGVSTLQAVPPQSFEGSGGGEAAIGYCEEQGFWVYESATWEAKGKNYFDKDGNWVKQRIHWSVEGFVFNASAPEMSLPYKNSVYTEHFDVEALESRMTGLWALVTLPGAGNIFIDVGILYFDWTDGSFTYGGGQHQWWDANVEELCAYLTP